MASTPPDASTLTATLLRSQPKISKKLLNEDDYPAWAIEATRQLRRQKLLDVVDGTRVRPDSGPEQAKWDDDSDKAIDYLMESCEEEPQLQIRAATTATIAWTTLREAYHGRTRIHLLHLFSAISSKFDDRKVTLAEHISTFEAAWLHLAQNVATATAGTNSMAAGIKNFTLTDSWKAAMLLQLLPRIQPYLNIVMNITSSEDTPTYANVVIRLKETQYNKVRSHTSASESTTATASAFATTEKKSCGYCKSKGRPGNSHWEKDCWSKRDNDKKKQQQVNSTTIDETMPENWYGELAFATTSASTGDIGTA